MAADGDEGDGSNGDGGGGGDVWRFLRSIMDQALDLMEVKLEGQYRTKIGDLQSILGFENEV